MDQFPELETERLRLRKLRPSDLSALLKYAGNPKINDQVLSIPYPYTEVDAIARMNFVFQGFKNAERYVFAITFREKDEVIGEIGLHLDKASDSAQLGYWIAEPFWGQGVASEAAGAVLAFGFDTLQLNKIYATHYPSNVASGKVMQRNGMIWEANLKAHYKIKNEYRDVVQYRFTKEEYNTFKKR